MRIAVASLILLLASSLGWSRAARQQDRLLQAKRQFESQDWSKMRGVGTTDLNQFVVLVRASPERVSRVLASEYGRPVTNAVHKAVKLGSANMVMFRIKGHTWTTVESVDGADRGMNRLGELLSKRLHAPAIYYAGGDTAGVWGYERWDSGVHTEHLEIGEGNGPSFWTKLKHRGKPQDGNPGLAYIDRSFAAWGLYVPDFNGDYFLGHQDAVPGQTYTIVNPGTELYITEGITALSRPPFERVDFFPGK